MFHRRSEINTNPCHAKTKGPKSGEFPNRVMVDKYMKQTDHGNNSSVMLSLDGLNKWLQQNSTLANSGEQRYATASEFMAEWNFAGVVTNEARPPSARLPVPPVLGLF